MDRNPYSPPAAHVVDPLPSADANPIESRRARVLRRITSLLYASAVATTVFALAWIRPPLSTSTLISTGGLFVGFGCVFAIVSLLIGLPLALLIEWCRIGTGWSYTAVAAITGALLAFGFGHRRTGGEVPNPHGGAVFSPWTRDHPGIDDFPRSPNELLGSIAFLALVGGILGFAYWYFYSHGPRRNHRAQSRT
jgi:hypothetical protein